MIVQDILRKKGVDVFTVLPLAPLPQAVARMVECNVGSLLVCDQAARPFRLLGIVTERDVLRAIALHKAPLSQILVREAMTSNLVTVEPTESTSTAMGLMTEHRTRHLPVVANGQLSGLISIGDVVKAHYDLLEQENHFMKSYIQGHGAERGTFACPG